MRHPYDLSVCRQGAAVQGAASHCYRNPSLVCAFNYQIHIVINIFLVLASRVSLFAIQSTMFGAVTHNPHHGAHAAHHRIY